MKTYRTLPYCNNIVSLTRGRFNMAYQAYLSRHLFIKLIVNHTHKISTLQCGLVTHVIVFSLSLRNHARF